MAGETPTSSNAAIENWRIEGKIGLVENGTSKSAFINWQQNSPDYRIELFGPFGRGRVSIIKHADSITFQDGDQFLTADSAEALLYKVSGLRMPVNWLQWWIRGLPSPDAPVRSTETSPQLATFEQGQWLIELSKYNQITRTTGDTYLLPGKVKISHPDYKLVFAIKSWKLGAKPGLN